MTFGSVGGACDMWADGSGQRRDLAGVVHADLEDPVDGPARHPGERQRYSPMVVVGGHRGMGGRACRKGNAQRLLGGGLADAAGDRDDARARPRPRGTAEGGERGKRVIDEKKGALAK